MLGPDRRCDLRPGLVEAHGGQKKAKPNEWLASHDAGYGPYLLKSYSAGHQLVLEANPSFFEPPKTKHIILNFIPDNETLLLDAQSGAADITLGLSNQAAHSLTSDSCCVVASFKSREGGDDPDAAERRKALGHGEEPVLQQPGLPSGAELRRSPTKACCRRSPTATASCTSASGCRRTRL